MDGLNWDLLNDGIGNPKNNKSLLLAHQTPPAMSMGVRETAETAVRAGIQHILFTVQPEEVPAAIDAYLKSLKPVPSPHLVNGQLSEAAQRGEKVFQDPEWAAPPATRRGCSRTCKPYDVGHTRPVRQARRTSSTRPRSSNAGARPRICTTAPPRPCARC